jgi:hypothetical protein
MNVLVFDTLMLFFFLAFLHVAVSIIVGFAAGAEAVDNDKPAFIVVIAFLVYGMFWLPLTIGKAVSRYLI